MLCDVTVTSSESIQDDGGAAVGLDYRKDWKSLNNICSQSDRLKRDKCIDKEVDRYLVTLPDKAKQRRV